MEGLWRKISQRGRFSVAGRMTVLRDERPPGGGQAASRTEGTDGRDVARWALTHGIVDQQRLHAAGAARAGASGPEAAREGLASVWGPEAIVHPESIFGRYHGKLARVKSPYILLRKGFPDSTGQTSMCANGPCPWIRNRFETTLFHLGFKHFACKTGTFFYTKRLKKKNKKTFAMVFSSVSYLFPFPHRVCSLVISIYFNINNLIIIIMPAPKP